MGEEIQEKKRLNKFLFKTFKFVIFMLYWDKKKQSKKGIRKTIFEAKNKKQKKGEIKKRGGKRTNE